MTVELFRRNYPNGRRVRVATDTGVSVGYSFQALDLYMGDGKARWTLRIPLDKATIIVRELQRILAEHG